MTARRPSAALAAAVVLSLAAGGPAAGAAVAEDAAAGAPERGLRGFLAVRGERVVAAENAARLFTPGKHIRGSQLTDKGYCRHHNNNGDRR